MKQLLIVFSLCLFVNISRAQVPELSADSISVYFNEIQEATKQHYNLWNQDLYSSLLLVDPKTREVYANELDSAGLFVKEGSVFKGALPNEISFANTAIEWNGKRWAMIILPLPDNKDQRINLLAHELFHKAQPSLGYMIADVNNGHLDTKNGRIYFRLELEALKQSVLSEKEKDRKEHLTNALIFRKYRNQLFPNTKSTENALELNEGMAEYTGQTVSGINKKENASKYFPQNMDRFITSPTFVRSFAYQTIPVYGYLLFDIKKGWNKDITDKTNLIDYVIQAFNIQIPTDLEKSIKKISPLYKGEAIVAEEIEREVKNNKLLAEYRTQFIEQPHFDIALEKMQFSFDPRNIVPLDNVGTVYPHIRITDVWGILTVKTGALVTSNWKTVTLTEPAEINERKIVGDGWILELEKDYTLIKENGNYKLKILKGDNDMQEVHDFLKKCGTYYIATVEGDQPRVRPFGTVNIFDGKLHIQTGKVKNVAKQIAANPKIEICAFDGAGQWIRIQAIAVEDTRREAKQSMLDAYPSLQGMYSADDDNTLALYLTEVVATFASFSDAPKVVTF